MSSTQCPCPVSSSSVGATLTGGIQDVSALLPLLGTEQCEGHASSALTKGYLYAAATPMSLFGSLGLARAGLKTFVASLNFSVFNLNVPGARMLSNMGFRPQGTNLPLIMADESDRDKRHLVETRLDRLLEELHIDKTKITAVRHNSWEWNTFMITYSAFFCLLSMIPYIYLNLRGDSSLSHSTRWAFPAVRAIGGFLTATMMQLIIQQRITALSRQWLAKGKTINTTGQVIPGQHTNSVEVLELDQRGEGSGVANDHDLEKGYKPTGTPDNSKSC